MMIFSLHGSDSKIFVWRKPITELAPKNTKATMKQRGALSWFGARVNKC